MSLSFLSEATYCDKRSIQRELKSLEDRKIIHQQIKSGSYRKISFNKNHDQWVGRITIGETTNPRVGKTANGGVGKTTNGTIGETANQERYIDKSKDKSKERDDGQMKPNLFTEYEKNFGIIPPIFQNDVDYWLDNSSFEEPEQIIIEVINRAKEHKPKNPAKYINTMLKNLHEASLYTLKQVQDHYKQNDRKKDKKSVLDELREEWGVTNE